MYRKYSPLQFNYIECEHPSEKIFYYMGTISSHYTEQNIMPKFKILSPVTGGVYYIKTFPSLLSQIT